LNVDIPLPDELVSELQRLDRLLERAVAAAQAAYGPASAADPYRGLYVGQDEVARLLARRPGSLTLRTAEPTPAAAEHAQWSRVLEREFGLTPFDVDVILIVLAPELDSRYERLYAYLQDDVTRRRPSVDLVLNLLCGSLSDKLERRAHFAADAPLLQHDLLHLVADPQQVQPTLLSHYLKLDEQIIGLLLHQDNADARLAPACQLVEPKIGLDDLPLSLDLQQMLRTASRRAREARQSFKFYFHGLRGVGKRRTAEALAGEIGQRLLVVDLAHLTAELAGLQGLKLVFREAYLRNAILYLDGTDALEGDEASPRLERLLDLWAEDKGITILAGTTRGLPSYCDVLGVIDVPFALPSGEQRRRYWEENLQAEGLEFVRPELEVLADRYILTPRQIANAVVSAQHHALWRGSEQPTPAELFEAARVQSGHDLARLAQKIEPVHGWDDIVVPPDAVTQLHEICARVAHRQRVLGEWGFGRKLSLGRGINALFTGPPGTGKTMAAEIIAQELGLELYKIDLSSVVSKYIGETEKNLERIFTAAENANAILFFDEADALFGKRSEVRDSHDRYANIEIAYLLQKMEQYEGVTILATNLRQNMDEAFTRRLQFIVEFPFPDEAQRYHIWRIHFPAQAPRSEQIDLNFLAKQFRLCGGNIKNIVLSAAFLAAADGGRIEMDHLLHATQREFQKMGKAIAESELGIYTRREA
jgi:AAA+ superfamily predicted ATPase